MQTKFLNHDPFLRQLSVGVHYTSEKPGPRRLIFIAIHGNETCGVEAYLKICSQIPKLLQDGSLEVRLGNPLAFLLNQRSLNRDLNRSFNADGISLYESNLCEGLTSSLQNTDLFLDIHSTSSPGPAFVLPGKHGYSLCTQLPIDLVIQDLAEKCPGTTVSVVDAINVEGAVVECGQHNDQSSITVAYECIKAFIKSQPCKTSPIPKQGQKILQCPSSVIADEGFYFVQPIHFMQKFERNDLIALSTSKEFRCPYPTAFAIMPNSDPKAGEEAFYWGVE